MQDSPEADAPGYPVKYATYDARTGELTVVYRGGARVRFDVPELQTESGIPSHPLDQPGEVPEGAVHRRRYRR